MAGSCPPNSDLNTVISDSANYSNDNTPIARIFGAEAMLVTDSPLHRDIRKVWAKPASVSGVTAITGEIERVVGSLIEPVAERLNAGDAVGIIKIFEEIVAEVTALLIDISPEHKFDLLRWDWIISDSAVLALEDIGEHLSFLRDIAGHSERSTPSTLNLRHRCCERFVAAAGDCNDCALRSEQLCCA